MLKPLLLKNKNVYQISLVMMAVLYIVAGLNHFRMPDFYVMMMPPFLPEPYFLVILSGVIEIALGIGLLIPKTRKLSAWGVIALLIAIFPANLYMFQESSGVFAHIPEWVLIIRLPFQLILIAWAYVYTKDFAQK